MSGYAAAIVTYETRQENFASRGERNEFYRGLFGYRQVVRRNDKVYRYEKDGLLDEVPHRKVADAVLLVPRDHLDTVTDYLEEWRGKVEYDVIRVTLEDEEQITG